MNCTRIVRYWRYRILAASSVILVVILFPLALLRSTRLEQEPAVNTTTNLPRFQYNSTQPSTIKALKKLCISKAWDKDLIFSCYDVNGGLGNVNAFILECVRYAIQAGATGLVLPRIQARSQIDISVLVTGFHMPLSYMYDVDWFQESLRLSCPQIKVYNDIESVPHFSKARIPDRISPLEIHGDSEKQLFNLHPRTFKEDLAKHLGADSPAINADLEDDPNARILPPTIVRLHAKIFEFPARWDSDEFFHTFGRILRFREDVYQLAAGAYGALRGLTHSSQEAPNYLGVHLRVEKDIASLGPLWPSYEVQRDQAFSKVGERQSKVIYVASGDVGALERMKKEAAVQDIRVISKHDLLDKAGLKELSRLTWDQQAMIDFLILRSSTFFVGNFPSSFSCQLAYARHLDVAEPGNSKFPFPQDSRSQIIGREYEFFRWGMWPLSDKLPTND